jgi:DNA modification methylase
VLDPFAGSNTTGSVAESLGRRWIAIERDAQYAEDSGLRFRETPAEIASAQPTLF